MRLKKLQLHGFKSFVQKTEFEFPGGITGLVGPNGCGKSNVVDAIRWVLGEQRARQLRGSEMADIIFSGTDRRKPLGMAEATLIFDNSDRSLAWDGDEVAVTRRLYRSGESEYLINNKQVRLRDIREMFMDTGIGASSYSIIEQGTVAFLLTAGKKERRQIFEEAAGISKYKARKKQAEAKLEHAEQSLLRVRDIIEELEKRLRSVRMQASRAARFKAYSEELRELRMAIYSRDYRRLTEELENTNRRIEREKSRRSSVQANLARLDAGSSDITLKLGRLQEKLQALYGRRAELNTQLEVAAEQIRSFEERLVGIDHFAEEASAQIAEHTAKEREVAAGIEEERRCIESARKALEEVRARAEEISGQVEAAQARLVEARAAVESLRRETTALVYEETQLSNRLAAKESERNSARAVLDRLGMKSVEIAAEIEKLAAERNALAERSAETRLQLEANQGESASFGHKIDEVVARLDDERHVANGLRDKLARMESRRDILTGLEARREGIASAVKKFLDEAHEGKLEGVRGIVADYVEVEPRFARAVEVILGERAQAIVIDTIERAVLLGRKAREENLTGVRFLPERNEDFTPFSGPIPDGTVRAADCLRGSPEAVRLVSRLLGGSLIVEDLDKALDVYGATRGFVRVATLDGDMIDLDGSLAVGLAGTGAGLISRRGELKELERRIGEKQNDLAESERRIEELRGRLDSFKNAQAELAAKAEELKSAIIGLEGSIARIEDRARHLADERTVTEAERRDLEGRVAECEREIDQLKGESARLAEKRAQLDGRLQQALDGESQWAQTLHDKEAELSAAQVAAAQHTSEHEAHIRSLDMLEQSLADHREAVERLKAGIQQGMTNKQQTREEIENARTRREQARLELKDLGGQTARLEFEQDELRQQLAETDALVKRDRTDLHQIEDIIHSLDLEHQQLTMRLQALTDRAREEYELELSEYAANFVDDGRNWEETEARAEELAGKIKRIGPVNLEALDEMAELEIRAEQLKSQENDVLKAISDLKEIIRRNNRICVERFSATFEEVRKNFHEMFRKLFGSGRADLILEDPEDILECGIEIVAKPPGKEPAALSLISGGEKAMTAVALLFAIFKTKPSPFCVMDEVDAPLDENNIDRFVAVLRDYTETTQFLVITHSKRTMAMTDCLYGITMEEPGVSKRVAVRFEQLETEPESRQGTVTGLHVRVSDRMGVKVDTFEVAGEKAADSPEQTVASEVDPAEV